MVFIIIITLILSCLSGILYRFGGEAKKGNKLDFLRDTFTRDFGCSLLNTLNLLILGFYLGIPLRKPFLYALLASWGLTYASLTTYHTWINKLLKKPKEDKIWINWLVTGLVCGLASFPFCMVTHQWIALLIRISVLGIGTMIWSELVSKDTWEERGRGFLLIISNLFYLIK